MEYISKKVAAYGQFVLVLSESTTIRVKRYLLIRNNDIILAPPQDAFLGYCNKLLDKMGGGGLFTPFFFSWLCFAH